MRQDWRIIGLFIGGVLVLGTIVGGPLLYSIKPSFYTAASFIDPPQWVGLGNYVQGALVERCSGLAVKRCHDRHLGDRAASRSRRHHCARPQ